MRQFKHLFRSLPAIAVLFAAIALNLSAGYLMAQDLFHWGGQTEVTHTHDDLKSVDPAHAHALPAGPLYGVPCIAGFAGPFPCDNVDLLAYLPDNMISLSTGSDMWGWTDPATGKEYAILGQSDAIAFVDISTPTLPVYLGHLPAPVHNILWRDVKVYNNHAYIVGDGNLTGPHGLQIFDLTQLRGASAVPAIFEQSAQYTGFGNAHNLAINEATGTAYIVGSNTCSAGLHMLGLSDALNPAFLGCYAEDGYTHDVQCVVYHGPDSEYAGREICMAANEDTLTIIDVTDKSSPVMLSRLPYEGSGYTHQGWLTEDHAYFLLGDELDELNAILNQNPHNTHTYIWDVRNLDAPVHFSTYVGPTTAIDHNLYIRDGHVFESNYTAGLRILDASAVAAGTLTEVGYFDTHPADDATAFAGTWSNYAFFESGVVAVNNIEDGFFVLQPHLPLPATEGSQATGGGWLATNQDKKLNFGFSAETGSQGVAGTLELRDKEAGVNIEMTITFLGKVSEPCGNVTAGAQSMELRGSGTLNGSSATFRACMQDNGNPGKGNDVFYLACTNNCEYKTEKRTPDATIDGGNIRVRHGAASSGDEPQADTLILDPLLLSEGVVGSLQLFEVRVYDQNQAPLTDATVTLTRVAADGSTMTLSAVTDLTGLATFSVLNLSQPAEYIAASGAVESNAIALDPLLQ